MDIQTCAGRLRDKAQASPNGDVGLTATLKFDCGADGAIFLDSKTVPNQVTLDSREADCTVSIALADLGALLDGKLNPTNAFMTGKLKVSGDMGVALKLQRLV